MRSKIFAASERSPQSLVLCMFRTGALNGARFMPPSPRARPASPNRPPVLRGSCAAPHRALRERRPPRSAQHRRHDSVGHIENGIPWSAGCAVSMTSDQLARQHATLALLQLDLRQLRGKFFLVGPGVGLTQRVGFELVVIGDWPGPWVAGNAPAKVPYWAAVLAATTAPRLPAFSSSPRWRGALARPWRRSRRPRRARWVPVVPSSD